MASERICTTQEFNKQLSAGKIVASVFWDSETVIHVDFFLHDVTISAEYYSNLLRSDTDQAWESPREHPAA
jgi:hypothetical protein